MKILILSGSHPRHFYLHKAVLDFATDYSVILMQRENVIPEAPHGLNALDSHLYTKHFTDRHEIESSVFGDLSADQLFSTNKILTCRPDSLNSEETASFVRQFSPDIAVIFGTNIIKDPLLSELPYHTINVHLGLSPWYRGSATLFWPFYFLQPQFCGVTFHQIVAEADAGGILHQFATPLERGDGIHDVGARSVVLARNHLLQLLRGFDLNSWTYVQQTVSGRLFLTRDFQPQHLRLIYDLYDNQIVDNYLDHSLEQRLPKLIPSKLVNI